MAADTYSQKKACVRTVSGWRVVAYYLMQEKFYSWAQKPGLTPFLPRLMFLIEDVPVPWEISSHNTILVRCNTFALIRKQAT